MRILIKYLKPYKWLVTLVLALAAINIGFSLIDPIILGKLVNLATFHEKTRPLNWHDYLFIKTTVTTQSTAVNKSGVAEIINKKEVLLGVIWLLLASISVAMISRIAKAFQDYFLNLITQKFGATVFTQGLQHAMKLPYQEFEDARSGETLSILQKVRIDTEKFVSSFINILFPVIIGIIFVAIYATTIHWTLPIIYFGGISLLIVISNLLSKKVKIIQKKIVTQTNALAGATTESLRNIELVKSL
jgi:ATP-binding cassette, subfamily B, bacterial